MRRILSLFFAVLVIMVLSCNPVFAASGTYDLDELELQITIPSGYSVITRDTPTDDPIFSTLGTTKAALLELFVTGNIYLNAISDVYNEEIVVTMTENTLSDFNILSDTVLESLASSLVDQYVDYGINVSQYDIYQHSQAKFVRVFFTDTGKTVHGLQYYTIYNGKAMNFTMRSYEGNLSTRQEDTIKSIVDSIKFDSAPMELEAGEDTDAFVYTDRESGVTFTVPANWKEEPFYEEREIIDVKFASTKEKGCVMIYGSTDIWEQMSVIERTGYKRSDVNNSILTKADLAEMCNTTVDKISIVTYNGVQYYRAESKTSSEAYGVELSVTTTNLVRVDNGWMYMFQFLGTSTHKLYPDFESVMESVKYTSEANGAETVQGSNTAIDNDDSTGIIAVVILLGFVATVAIVLVITRKRRSEATYTPSYTPAAPRVLGTPVSTSTCKNCGQVLPSDSRFCHVCGTKIEKGN